MCGIFGYSGDKQAGPILIKGLKALEYRGYDSAGVYISESGIVKAVGQVKSLEAKLSKDTVGTVGIAHTRWATHGKPTEKNAHPHSGPNGRIWLAHNGVIENYKELREELQKQGSTFKSDTDTEVVPHLIEKYLNKKITTSEAIRLAIKKLHGSFALAIVDNQNPDSIFVARKGSPLVLGIGKDECFIASDILPISAYTKKVIFLNDGEMGEIKKGKYKITDFNGKAVSKKISTIQMSGDEAEKKPYKHFMLKEIMEQPEVVKRALENRIKNGSVVLDEIASSTSKIKNIGKIIIVGCGTASYAGIYGKYLFEEKTGISTEVEVASEFRYRNPAINEKTLMIVLSQSGETADTLEAIREAKKKGVYVIGIINAIGSTMSREVDACIYNYAGPEIGVASTKAFMSQMTILALLSIAFMQIRSGNKLAAKDAVKELLALPNKIKSILKQNLIIKKLAQKYAKSKNFLFLGRKYQFPIALEGALKLKEISYIHAEGYASGEMKHGPLAMIDKDFPSVVITLKDALYEKNISTIQEIKARDGKVIAIASEGDNGIKSLADNVVYIPKVTDALAPILSVVPMQLFAYHVADLKKLNIDKPRNLAKSVTVE